MTKALLKNPRTTSDHGDAPHTARPHTITNEPKKNDSSDPNHSTNTNPTHNGRADARVHYPVLKPPPHQDTHPAPTGTGQPTWGTHWQPHPRTGGRWRPGNPTARTTPHNPIRLFHASKPGRRRQTIALGKPQPQKPCTKPCTPIFSVERR